MSTLTGRKIANSYKNLLQVETSNTDLDTSLKSVQTGAGNNTPLQLSTDKINLTGTLQINGTTLTAGAATLNAVADLTGATGLVAVSAGNIHGRSIAVGNPLTISNANGTEGNPTINLASSGVSASTYGPMVNFTVDNFGRITDVTVTTTISANAFVGGTISGSALTVENDTSIGGDVVIEGTTNMKAISATDVTFNNLTVNTKINAVTVTATTIETSILRATTISVTDLTANNINFDNVSVSSLVANVGLFNGDVTFTGDSGNIVFDKSDDALEFADDIKAVFGTGSDLQIFHNGNNSFIKDFGTGALILQTNDLKVHNAGLTDLMIRAIQGNQVELYYNNGKKFETTSTGATVTGTLIADGVTLGDGELITFGTDNDATITHDGVNLIIDSNTGTTLYHAGQHQFKNQFGSETHALFSSNGAVNLYYDNELRFRTTSTGIDVLSTDDDGSSDNTANIRIIAEGTNEILTFRSNDGVGSYISRNGDNYGTHLFQGFGGTESPDTVNMLQLTSTGHTFYQDLTLTSTDVGASEDPNLILYRNSSSPADNDATGTIQFQGRNDNSQDVIYGEIQSSMLDVSDGAEDGSLSFQTRKAGTQTTYITLSGASGRVNILQELFIGTGNKIKFEGATSNANETTLTVTDPTADRIITLPDATGTVLVDDGSGNVAISGNLTVSGTTTTVNSSTLSVQDPLIILANNNNSSDVVDIGFYGLYDTSGSQDLYAGLFRDASDSGKFKLFKDLQVEPTTTVNTGGTGYAVGTLVAGLEVPSGSTVTLNSDNSNPAMVIQGGGPNEIMFAADQFGNATDGVSLLYRTTPNNLEIVKASGLGVIAKFNGNTGVAELWHSNVGPKLATTSTGVTVGGTLVADGVSLGDNDILKIGNSDDFQILHNGSQTALNNLVGNVIFRNYANDADIDIMSDDGSGSTTTYFRADGSTGEVQLFHYGSQKFKTFSGGIVVSSDNINASYSSDVEGIIIKSAMADSATDENISFRVETSPDGGTADKAFDIVQVTNGNAGGTDIQVRLGNRFTNNATPSEIVLNSNDASITADNMNLIKGSNSKLKFTSPDGSSEGYQIRANVSDVADFGLLIEDLGGNDIAKFLDGGAVELYHNHVKKLETTSTGATITGNLELTSTDSGASSAPIIELYRHSASPAASDKLGRIDFYGEDDNDDKLIYASIEGAILQPTDGNERGHLLLNVMQNGSIQSFIDLTANQVTINKPITMTQGANSIQFEGATNDANDTVLQVADPTADRTITLPDATGTVLLDTGNQTLTGDLTFPDNEEIKIGTDGDLRIYHNGSNSYIDEGTGTGALIFKSNFYSFRNAADSAQMAIFSEGGSVRLFHNGADKFNTLSDGAKVFGDLTLQNSDDDANQNPSLILYRNSASPADSDDIGEIIFRGRNDNSQDVDYIQMMTDLTDVSDGTESAQLIIKAMENGTLTQYASFNGGGGQIYFSRLLNMQSNAIFGVSNLQFSGTHGSDSNTQIKTEQSINQQTSLVLQTGDDATTNNEDDVRIRHRNYGNATPQDLDMAIFKRNVSDNSKADITFNGDLTLLSTDAGATAAPTLSLYRNSASPTGSDDIGQIQFFAENDADEKVEYARIDVRNSGVTDGAEYGQMDFMVRHNGGEMIGFRLSFNLVQFYRDLYIGAAYKIQFEGNAYNDFETSLTVASPTADRTITLPDATGEVIVTSGGQTMTSHLQFADNAQLRIGDGNDLVIRHDGNHSLIEDNGSGDLYIRASDNLNIQADNGSGGWHNAIQTQFTGSNSKVAFFNGGTQVFSTLPNGISIDVSGGIRFEGATADGNETFLQVADPTADRTITLPDATGTVVLQDSNGDATIGGGLTVTGGNSGDVLLTFATDRSWQFQQSGDNASTRLQLKSNVDSKLFDIVNSSGNVTHTFFTSTADPSMTLTAYDADATEGPKINLTRNSASPAVNDLLGAISFKGEDSAGNEIEYARITGIITDPTDGSEDGLIRFEGVEAGNRFTAYQIGYSANFFYRDLHLMQNVDIRFEGSTNDSNETTLTVVDPTADRTITLPDATGDVVLNESGTVNIESTDGGSSQDPNLVLFRNSSSPADFDNIGQIFFRARNDNSQDVDYARIYSQVTDASDSSEDAYLRFFAKVGGTEQEHFRIGFATTDFFGRIRITGNQVFSNPVLIFEGSTANSNETTLAVTDPTADRTITLPDATGTINELLISSGSVSNVSSIDFNSSILTTEFSSYRLVLLNVKPVTDDVDFSMRVGTANSADSGTNYMQSNFIYGVYDNSGTSTQAGLSVNGHALTAFSLAYSTAGLGTGTGENGHFEISLLNANSTSCYKHIRLNQSIYSYYPVLYSRRIDAGLYKSNSPLNFVTLFCSSGNIASADYRLYGVK